jgi:hypothetical protein
MKSNKQQIKIAATAIAVVLLISQPVMAGEIDVQDPGVAVANQAYRDAELERMTELARLANDRQAVIDYIVWTWGASESLSSDAQAEFSEQLGRMNESQLLAIWRNAGSYEEVIHILKGNDPADFASSSIADLSGVQNLGSVTDSLVFWPVDPCRVVDTRLTGAGQVAAGTSRDFRVHGNAATMSAQGGNPAGCLAPNGEPSGVVINVTSTNHNPGFGFLTVYPFTSTRPDASLLNYSPGVDIANSTVQKTCYLCGEDISIYTAVSPSDVIVDVQGYYYAASEDDFKVKFAGSNTSTNTALPFTGSCTHAVGGEVTITVPRPGKITVEAQAWMYMAHNTGTNDWVRVYIEENATTCDNSDHPSQGYVQMFWGIPPEIQTTGRAFNTIPLSRTFTVTTPGTYTYYLNGRQSAGLADKGFEALGMQATFYPDP